MDLTPEQTKTLVRSRGAVNVPDHSSEDYGRIQPGSRAEWEHAFRQAVERDADLFGVVPGTLECNVLAQRAVGHLVRHGVLVPNAEHTHLAVAKRLGGTA